MQETSGWCSDIFIAMLSLSRSTGMPRYFTKDTLQKIAPAIESSHNSCFWGLQRIILIIDAILMRHFHQNCLSCMRFYLQKYANRKNRWNVYNRLVLYRSLDLRSLILNLCYTHFPLAVETYIKINRIEILCARINMIRMQLLNLFASPRAVAKQIFLNVLANFLIFF